MVESTNEGFKDTISSKDLITQIETSLLKCDGECTTCSEHTACNTPPAYQAATSHIKKGSVVIRDIKEEPVALHYKNEFIGYIHTKLSLYDVMCQIADKAVDGYSIKFKNEEFPITKWGHFCSDAVVTFFPLSERYLDRLLQLS